jgi:hypothetical protein
MSELSLQKSIRTCKVVVGNADRIESDRFLNQNNLLCPMFTGRDLTGRQVCVDSFYTKSEGCNSSNDRIVVENDLRPKYFDYVALNAAGVSGHIYGQQPSADAISFKNNMNLIGSQTGNFGLSLGSDVRNTACSVNPYDASQQRQNTVALNSYFNSQYRNSSGF